MSKLIGIDDLLFMGSRKRPTKKNLRQMLDAAAESPQRKMASQEIDKLLHRQRIPDRYTLKKGKPPVDSDAIMDFEGFGEFPLGHLERNDLPITMQGLPSGLDPAIAPGNIEKQIARAQKGAEMGGWAWYDMSPLYKFAMDEIDPAEQQYFDRFMKLGNPLSIKTRVPREIRNASVLNSALRHMGDEGFPDRDMLPSGMQMMPLHMQLAQEAVEKGSLKHKLKTAPKIASYELNKLGNLYTPTIDTRELKAWGMRESESPPAKGALGLLEQELSARSNVMPAQWQSSHWSPPMAGEVGNDPNSYALIVDRLARKDAELKGVNPKQHLIDILTGKDDLSINNYAGGGRIAKTEQYIRSLLPEQMRKLPMKNIRGGSGREAFWLGDDKIAKIARLPEEPTQGDYYRGLYENTLANEPELQKHGLLPKVHYEDPLGELEVVEGLKEHMPRSWMDRMETLYYMNRGEPLIEAAEQFDPRLKPFFENDYDLLMGDFFAPRHWRGRQQGFRKPPHPVLIDEGALSRKLFDYDYAPNAPYVRSSGWETGPIHEGDLSAILDRRNEFMKTIKKGGRGIDIPPPHFTMPETAGIADVPSEDLAGLEHLIDKPPQGSFGFADGGKVYSDSQGVPWWATKRFNPKIDTPIKGMIGRSMDFTNDPIAHEIRDGSKPYVKPKSLWMAEGGHVPTLKLDRARQLLAKGGAARNFLRGVKGSGFERVLEKLKAASGARRLQNEPINAETLPKQEALAKWIDTNLANYLIRQHGTENDPLRSMGYSPALGFKPAIKEIPAADLADRYKAEAAPGQKLWGETPPWLQRYIDEDMPRHKSAEEYAKAKKSISGGSNDPDLAAIGSRQHDEFYRPGGIPADSLDEYNSVKAAKLKEIETKYGRRNAKPVTLFDVDEEEFGRTYERPIRDTLDYLRQAYTPDELHKVSVPDAMRKSAEWHDQMAKKAAEAEMADVSALPVYKQYPTGEKWVQMGGRGDDAVYRSHESDGFVTAEPDDEAAREMNAAQAIGRKLGHCYQHPATCEQYLSEGKLYSLIDAKGNPRVTIDASPYSASGMGLGHLNSEEREWAAKSMPMDINQIRGPQNKEVPDDALPFVQDFIKSGKWGEVGELDAARLKKGPNGEWLDLDGDDFNYAEGGFVDEEAYDFLAQHLADGGSVEGYDYLASVIQPADMPTEQSLDSAGA